MRPFENRRRPTRNPMRKISYACMIIGFPGLLAMNAAVAQAAPDASGDLQVDAARRVMSGRDRVHASFEACESRYRASGFDSRFFVGFWDFRRFEVFAGAAATLKRATVGDESGATGTVPPGRATAVSSATCADLATGDRQGRFDISGVSESDVQLMRDAYAATKPDPHIARDRSLHNDCMKANFNVRQMNFFAARFACDCTVTVMQSVSQAQLDGWLERSWNGALEPMQDQPWFEALWPKMKACLASTGDSVHQSTQSPSLEISR
jgi:hypothetical protein